MKPLNNIIKNSKYLFITLLMLTASSCSTMKNIFFNVVETQHLALIVSEPKNAEVYTLSGDLLGVTPLKLTNVKLKKYTNNKFISLTIKKNGYVTREIVAQLKGIDSFNVNLTPLNPKHFEKWVLKTYSNKTNEMTRSMLNIQGLLFLKKFNRAHKEISEFQKDYPNIAATYTMLGNVYFHMKKYKESKEQLLRSLSIDNKDETTIRFLKVVNKKLANL